MNPIRQRMILIALLFPLIVLACVTGYRAYRKEGATILEFPIRGRDPRSLISGRYLTYTVNYGAPVRCEVDDESRAYLCLRDQTVTYVRPKDCAPFVTGMCRSHEFLAGIERFYIPDDLSGAKLETWVQVGRASIRVALSDDGTAAIRELFIDGKPWREKARE